MTFDSGRSHREHLRFRQRPLFASDVAARIEIKAPLDTVWQALTDFERYPEWNVFTPTIETTFEIGSPVHMRVVMPSRFDDHRTEWINLIEQQKTICWGMHLGHPVFLCANRWQELRALGPNRTEYSTTDKLSGLLAPLVMARYGQPMKVGFQSVADNLKLYVETGRKA